MKPRVPLGLLCLLPLLSACPGADDDGDGQDEVGETGSEDGSSSEDGSGSSDSSDGTGTGTDDSSDGTGTGTDDTDDSSDSSDTGGVEACAFAVDEPIAWDLPAPIGGDDLHELTADSLACNNAEDYRFSTFDLTGDGAPDLVVTDLCDAAEVGSLRWEVYANAGEGFAPEPTAWTLPAPIGGDDLHEVTADSLACNNAEDYRFSTFDLTGDGAPDLVVTDLCDAAGVGSEIWEVYANTGAGFEEAPLDWFLPTPIGGADPHEVTADNLSCANSEDYRFSTLDLTGDGAPDLVVTDLCDAAGVGSERWDVYPNTGDGFAAEPIAWALPAPIGGDDLHELTAGNLACNNDEDYRFSIFDLTGDGAPDLVVTDLCDAAGVGSERWDVYPNTGEGFAAEPIAWPLPAPIGGDDLHELTADSLACNNDEDYRYLTLDLTGDGAPELVVTDLCDAAAVGGERWDVYVNTGEGFAAEPIAWPLPAPIGGDDLHELTAESLACNNDEDYRFSTFDLTGDAAPDLVVTDLCDPAEVGSQTWQVYRATCDMP